MRAGPKVTEGSDPSSRSADSTKRRQTRAALIEAAHGVFAEHGLSGATIDQVTQAAGFTRGAFYSNFGSKEELMLAAMDRERELSTARMSRYIEQIAADDTDFTIDDLTTTLIEVLLIGTVSRDWQLALMEALPVTLRDPVLIGRQLQIRARAEADTRLLMSQGLHRLERRPTLDADLLVLLVVGAVERIKTDTLLEDALGDFPTRAGSAIAALLLHASTPIDD
ncbi:TetR/AcrR family transcriptional regulator [Aeromicrobium sp. CF3.5]|uniref:TetR/AcrR family transcriptional regulator n=1 Tax=Aeromicrobium sp. CF3.5 TaxID=3373078 RepID=UPI003EE4F082